MHLRRFLRNRAIGLTRRTLAPMARWRAARTPVMVPLESVRRRLELLLAAMYGRSLSVGPLTRGVPVGAAPARDILLPSRLEAEDGVAEAMERYRLLAIEQAARLVRGSADAPLPADPIVRDLYVLAEGASIDADIATRAPGLVETLMRFRRAELATRPALHRVRPAERDVESLLQSLLSSSPRADVPSMPCTRTPSASREWARELAARLRAQNVAAAQYAGVWPVSLWFIGPAARMREPLVPMGLSLLRETRTESPGTPSAGQGKGPGEDAEDGAPHTDGTGAATDAPAPRDSDAEREPDAGGARAVREPTELDSPDPAGGIHYPEWDEYAGRYRPDEVTVRAGVARETDNAWAADTLRTHAPLVRQVRARFAPLRANRARMRAQRSGDELDLDACVAALVEIRRGRVPDERLYQLTKPARRTLAIMLLVDVSGSTTASLADGRTVLDVERMTLLLASEALDELGDPYAVLAFSSSGRHDVTVDAIKTFAEHDQELVRRRVSALTSARNTRLGAALRHATALLNAEPAERRLLLLLSDGQPNDVGGYQGSYAIGDSRRAVLEARASGVHPFCLTVDREEQEYLPQLFGTNGYRILREPSQLPAALLQVVTQSLPA